MAKRKIAVFGASGFVGATLCERLYFEQKYDFVPIIHSFGNAARLARFPIKLNPVDILNYDQVRNVLGDCDVVINCIKGKSVAMTKGLKNILKASQNNKIEKYIHLSSIAIYGEDPPPESATEAAEPDPGSNSYGAMKLKQDEIVFKFHQAGLPAFILCPSNIAGPYSPFVFGAAKTLLADEILLVDDGKHPTNLIHVENLVEAILTAVESETGGGERYFINEIEQTTWKEFYESLQKILGINNKLRSVPRDNVLKALAPAKTNHKFSDNFKILVSGEFRNALSVFPLFQKLNMAAYNTIQGLNPGIQKKLRKRLEKPIKVKPYSKKVDLTQQFIRVQVRLPYHSPEKIMTKLGYKPLLNYQRRLRNTEEWLRFANIV